MAKKKSKGKTILRIISIIIWLLAIIVLGIMLFPFDMVNIDFPSFLVGILWQE